jgi:hypothetical protein
MLAGVVPSVVDGAGVVAVSECDGDLTTNMFSLLLNIA